MYTLVNISGIALKHVSPPVAGSGILERGEGWCRGGEGGRECFDAPSHIHVPYVFVLRIVNKIHIEHNAC